MSGNLQDSNSIIKWQQKLNYWGQGKKDIINKDPDHVLHIQKKKWHSIYVTHSLTIPRLLSMESMAKSWSEISNPADTVDFS